MKHEILLRNAEFLWNRLAILRINFNLSNTVKVFRSYSVHEKEINLDFNGDLQAAIIYYIYESYI